MNKNCVGCSKSFLFDEVINPTRKYCSKNCYLNFVRGKGSVEVKKKESSKLVKFIKTLLRAN